MHLPNRPSPDQPLSRSDPIRDSLGLAGRVRTGETHAVLSFGTLFSCQGAITPPGTSRLNVRPARMSAFRGAITARACYPLPITTLATTRRRHAAAGSEL